MDRYQAGNAGFTQGNDQDLVGLFRELLRDLPDHQADPVDRNSPAKDTELDPGEPVGEEPEDQAVPDFGLRDIIAHHYEPGLHGDHLLPVCKGPVRLLFQQGCRQQPGLRIDHG